MIPLVSTGQIRCNQFYKSNWNNKEWRVANLELIMKPSMLHLDPVTFPPLGPILHVHDDHCVQFSAPSASYPTLAHARTAHTSTPAPQRLPLGPVSVPAHECTCLWVRLCLCACVRSCVCVCMCVCVSEGKRSAGSAPRRLRHLFQPVVVAVMWPPRCCLRPGIRSLAARTPPASSSGTRAIVRGGWGCLGGGGGQEGDGGRGGGGRAWWLGGPATSGVMVSSAYNGLTLCCKRERRGRGTFWVPLSISFSPHEVASTDNSNFFLPPNYWRMGYVANVSGQSALRANEVAPRPHGVEMTTKWAQKVLQHLWDIGYSLYIWPNVWRSRLHRLTSCCKVRCEAWTLHTWMSQELNGFFLMLQFEEYVGVVGEKVVLHICDLTPCFTMKSLRILVALNHCIMLWAVTREGFALFSAIRITKLKLQGEFAYIKYLFVYQRGFPFCTELFFTSCIFSTPNPATLSVSEIWQCLLYICTLCVSLESSVTYAHVAVRPLKFKFILVSILNRVLSPVMTVCLNECHLGCWKYQKVTDKV